MMAGDLLPGPGHAQDVAGQDRLPLVLCVSDQADSVVCGSSMTARRGRRIVPSASGGVRVRPAALVQRDVIEIRSDGSLSGERSAAVAKKPSGDNWWWD